jgi:hypothetical protein
MVPVPVEERFGIYIKEYKERKEVSIQSDPVED